MNDSEFESYPSLAQKPLGHMMTFKDDDADRLDQTVDHNMFGFQK